MQEEANADSRAGPAGSRGGALGGRLISPIVTAQDRRSRPPAAAIRSGCGVATHRERSGDRGDWVQQPERPDAEGPALRHVGASRRPRPVHARHAGPAPPVAVHPDRLRDGRPAPRDLPVLRRPAARCCDPVRLQPAQRRARRRLLDRRPTSTRSDCMATRCVVPSIAGFAGHSESTAAFDRDASSHRPDIGDGRAST